jgi:hypothetical protein
VFFKQKKNVGKILDEKHLFLTACVKYLCELVSGTGEEKLKGEYQLFFDFPLAQF